MRHIYRVLACMYDPLGYLLPFTTRAKILVQQLWRKEREWDDPLLPHHILTAWKSWEEELHYIQHYLPQITIPQCYTSKRMDSPTTTRDIHIFSDASEHAYGAVAYLRSEDKGQVELSFILARSRISPKQQLSVPRLELCAALTGAHLCDLISKELSFPIRDTTLWTVSTTVLHWLKADSCRFKVFVGARVSEIQNLTNSQDWRYVDSATNPADDVTRGKSLPDILSPNRWNNGPPFLYGSPDTWPELQSAEPADDQTELKKSYFCGVTNAIPNVPNLNSFKTYHDLLDVTAQSLSNLTSGNPSASDYLTAEQEILRQAQMDSFGEDLACLQSHKLLPPHSRLLCLSPELCGTSGLIHVGGQLRQSHQMESESNHPIVLDPSHHVTKLMIQDYDEKLHHTGSERLFAEIRQKILDFERTGSGTPTSAKLCHVRSGEQRQSSQRWLSTYRSSQVTETSLLLYRNRLFWTSVKVGRRSEKRWGIIFKCLTTQYLDILSNMDTDFFLIALRLFS